MLAKRCSELLVLGQGVGRSMQCPESFRSVDSSPLRCHLQKGLEMAKCSVAIVRKPSLCFFALCSFWRLIVGTFSWILVGHCYHFGDVFDISFNDDGDQVAIASQSNNTFHQCKIWKWWPRECLTTIPTCGFENIIRDSIILITQVSFVQAWDALSCKCICTWQGDLVALGGTWDCDWRPSLASVDEKFCAGLERCERMAYDFFPVESIWLGSICFNERYCMSFAVKIIKHEGKELRATQGMQMMQSSDGEIAQIKTIESIVMTVHAAGDSVVRVTWADRECEFEAIIDIEASTRSYYSGWLDRPIKSFSGSMKPNPGASYERGQFYLGCDVGLIAESAFLWEPLLKELA